MSARTFGELKTHRVLSRSHRCSFCKRDQWSAPDYPGARRYSTRHAICDDCIAQRAELVLPSVRKWERFVSRMAAASAKA